LQIEEIWASNPAGNHCLYISENPSACINIDGNGKICPNNPHFGPRKDSLARIKEFHPLLDRAEEVFDRHRLGFIKSADDLTPEEFTLLSVFTSERDAIRINQQSESIGIELRKILRELYGNGKGD